MATKTREIGALDTEAINDELQKCKRRSKPQSKYTEEDRYLIAKYAKNHGASSAANHFKKKYPTIRESTVRGLVKKYNDHIKFSLKAGVPVEKKLELLRRGRPLMVGPIIDEKVKSFLTALFMKGGHISCRIAVSTALVLLSRSDDESLKNVVVTESWGRSFLSRIGFRRRAATTSKVEIPESTKKEAGIQYHYRITNIVKKHNIPPSLVLNSDQTPSKYVQVGRFTMAPQGSKKVGKVGSDDKRTITLTFTVTLDGKILPFQIIYKGKTQQSIPKVKFPEGFSLSANIKHHSNTEEVLKHLKEIVIPYVNAERRKLGKPDQVALLIWDVFRGQTTADVSNLLTENKILCEYVPNNMTDVYQPLDLTVNKWVKNKIMNRFNNWYRIELNSELDSGKSLDEVNIKFQLSKMKPLHAGWLIETYNELSSDEGKQVIISGWRAAGITKAIERGLEGFSARHIDPFYDLDPFDQEIIFTETSFVSPPSEEYVELERVIQEFETEDDTNAREYLPGVDFEVEGDESYEEDDN